MSLVATRLQNLRADANIDKNEIRASRYGAFNEFVRQSDAPDGIISDDLRQKAIAAIGSGLEIPVITGDTTGINITSTLPLVIANTENTSQLVQVTFVQYQWGFHIHPAKHMNNEIGMQRDFNTKFLKYLYKLAALLDTSAIAALEAAKTQVLADDLGGRYALTGNTVVAPDNEKGAFVGDINLLMEGNDYYGQLSLVHNGSFQSHVRNELREQGEYNERDKTYQYGDKMMTGSNRVLNEAGQVATAYAVSGGQLGILQQFEPDALMGSTTHKHQWGIDNLPMLGIPVGTYFYDDAADLSAIAGAATQHLTRGKVEAYGFAFRLAFVTPYNSDPANNASPIMKVALAAAV